MMPVPKFVSKPCVQVHFVTSLKDLHLFNTCFLKNSGCFEFQLPDPETDSESAKGKGSFFGGIVLSLRHNTEALGSGGFKTFKFPLKQTVTLQLRLEVVP
jgi:hypothetical protein